MSVGQSILLSFYLSECTLLLYLYITLQLRYKTMTYLIGNDGEASKLNRDNKYKSG